MFTVFLAFVVFTETGTTAPRIVEGFPNLTDCFIAARQKNLDTLNRPAKPGEGYVCLAIRGDV